MAKPAQIVTGAVLGAASLVLLPVAVGRAFAASRGDNENTSSKGAKPQPQPQEQPPAQAAPAGVGGPGTGGSGADDFVLGLLGEIGRAFEIGRGIAGDIRQDNKDKAAKDAAAAA